MLVIELEYNMQLQNEKYYIRARSKIKKYRWLIALLENIMDHSLLIIMLNVSLASFVSIFKCRFFPPLVTCKRQRKIVFLLLFFSLSSK